MSKTKNKTTSERKIQDNYTVTQALVNYYLALMFTVFPLFASNAYSNIRHDKYYFFLILTFVVLSAEFLIILYSKLDDSTRKDSFGKENTKPAWYKSLSLPDIAILVFLAVNVISTILSDYPADAAFGTAGRNNGLLLMAIYVGIYFLITRFYTFKEYVFLAFAGASAAVFLLAILNCFYIDPLGMFDGFNPITQANVIKDFTSTIGNKNLMSSYICIALPVFITMSVHTKNTAYRALYIIVSGLGFTALMTADSDSGILGIGVFIIVFFIWYSRRICRLKRYFLTLTVMLVSAKLLRLFSLIINDKSKGMDALQEIFVYSNTAFIFIIAAGLITALLYYIDYKKPSITLSKAVPWVLGIIFALCAVGAVGAVIYFSFIDTKTNLGSLERILRINDKWGTHRGYMWIRSMWIFGDFSFMEKLFGTGPDTFYYAFSPYFGGLQKYGDSFTNAAHNEYINYLITIGIAGLVSYIAAVGGSIARAIKTASKNPLAIVCVSAVICYSVQAFVNISQPITTPLFILFLALTEASTRYANQTGKSYFSA